MIVEILKICKPVIRFIIIIRTDGQTDIAHRGLVCGDCIAKCSGIVCEDSSVSSFDSYCEMREPVLPT